MTSHEHAVRLVQHFAALALSQDSVEERSRKMGELIERAFEKARIDKRAQCAEIARTTAYGAETGRKIAERILAEA